MNGIDYLFGANSISAYGANASANAGVSGNVSNTLKPGNASVSDASQSEALKNAGKTEKSKECQTCKKRKYQDGSNEMVSFKSAAHISPGAAASKVRAHEMEHVSNAFAKAFKGDGKVIQASVTLKTAVCPECGRVYVSGGETNTKIQYSSEEQPYQKQIKAFQEDALKGNNIDVKG